MEDNIEVTDLEEVLEAVTANELVEEDLAD